jgi:hypothetical protein
MPSSFSATLNASSRFSRAFAGIERVVVEQVRTVLVDQRAEREAVLPVGGEAADRRRVDVVVVLRLALAPEEQTLLRRHLLDRNALNLVVQNDRPDHAENHLEVLVDQVRRLEEVRLHAGLLLKHVERHRHVVELVRTHLGRLVVLGHRQAVQRRAQLHQLLAVLKLALNVIERGIFAKLFHQMIVGPFGERLHRL